MRVLVVVEVEVGMEVEVEVCAGQHGQVESLTG